MMDQVSETEDRPVLDFTKVKLAAHHIEDHAPTAPEQSGPYDPLTQVMVDAFDQAAAGKGHSRHSGNKPFLEQPILEIVRMQGESIDGHTYQIMKKAQEAGRMVTRQQYSAAIAELYGIINYAAAAVIRTQEIMTESGKEDRSAG